MRNRIGLLGLVLAGMLMAWGCGSSGDNGTVVRVVVTPSTKTLATGASAVFTATVTGASNTAVRWTATAGTLSSTSSNPVTYTAPGQAGTYTITATSAADSTISGSATVRVTASGVSIQLSPSAISTLQQGQQQQFTATVTGTTNTAVLFSATGGSFDNPSSNTPTYTAPTAPGTYTVTATSQADVSQKASVTFTVPGISIVVSPSTPTFNVNSTHPFTATVTGSANTAVTFSVQGINGTPSSGATITPGGAFSATQAGTYQVIATSQADNQTTGSTVVTVKSLVTISPAAQTVPEGATQQFQAIVAGSTDQGVTWMITDTNGNPINTGGTLSSTSANPVTYTAPLQAGVFLLKATSHFDGSTGSTTITVPASTITVTPGTAFSVAVNQSTVITATVSGSAQTGVSYSIQDVNGNPITTGGTLSSTTGSPVTYTAPATTGTFYLVVSNPAGGAPPVKITITVTPPTGSGVVIVQ